MYLSHLYLQFLSWQFFSRIAQLFVKSKRYYYRKIYFLELEFLCLDISSTIFARVLSEARSFRYFIRNSYRNTLKINLKLFRNSYRLQFDMYLEILTVYTYYRSSRTSYEVPVRIYGDISLPAGKKYFKNTIMYFIRNLSSIFHRIFYMNSSRLIATLVFEFASQLTSTISLNVNNLFQQQIQSLPLK